MNVCWQIKTVISMNIKNIVENNFHSYLTLVALINRGSYSTKSLRNIC